MDRITRAMPSPALVVAALALIAALAGTALAGSGPSASTSGKADKALKRAKKANKKASAAQSAANQALGQQDTFAYATNDTATITTLFEGGGLRIEASCPAGIPTVEARSLVDNSTIHLATIVNGTAHYNEGDDFDSNQTRSLAVGGQTDNVQGTFTFHNGNGANAPTVTATYLIEQVNFQANDCAAFGNIEIM